MCRWLSRRAWRPARTPVPDLRWKSTQNYPRSLRSAAQRWNIALNARRALANLAAFSCAVTAVVKSIVLMSFLPAQISAMLFMQHDKCGEMPTGVTIALIAHVERREHQSLDLQKQGSRIPS